MSRDPTHARLRTSLAHLYPNLADAKRIADDATVDHNRIAPDGNITNYWHVLLHEAQKQGKLAALLTCASSEYPQHHEFVATIAAYQREIAPLSNIRLLNFAHPITDDQQQQIETLLGKRIDLAIGRYIETKFDDTEPYEPQCEALIARVGYTSEQWQSLPLLINPPSFVPGSLCLISQLHGRMRHFPSVLRLRPITIDGARSYAVVEIMNLQEIRDRARK